MRLSGILGAAILAAVSILASGSAAGAADMPAIFGSDAPLPADQPLQFGSGWYLRGDGAFSYEDHPKLDVNRTGFDRNTHSDGYGLGFGAGYKFNSFLRADVTGDYLDPYHYTAQSFCTGTCIDSARDTITRFDGLVNGYIDLGTWSGFTPYVGGGAGVGGISQDISLGHADGSVQQSGRTTFRFAWAAMAGFSYAISPNMLLDVGYRYLDLGRLAVAVPTLPAVQKDIAAHQVRVRPPLRDRLTRAEQGFVDVLRL